MSVPTPQVLLIDADDTLWENHRYFLDVFRRFLSLMGRRGHDPEAVARRLRSIESERTRTHGYGSRNFARSLVETALHFEGEIDSTLEQVLLNDGEWIFHHPVEVFPGVEQTLDVLARRHRLILVTKGDESEQSCKIERSGLLPRFASSRILKEKDAASYREVVAELSLPPDRTWMVGNSPRSDINPARLAGLRTVFIPHRTIWELEDATFDGHPELTLARFSELSRHF